MVVAGKYLLDPDHVVSGKVKVSDHIVVAGLHDGISSLIFRQEGCHGDFLAGKATWHSRDLHWPSTLEVEDGSLDKVVDQIFGAGISGHARWSSRVGIEGPVLTICGVGTTYSSMPLRHGLFEGTKTGGGSGIALRRLETVSELCHLLIIAENAGLGIGRQRFEEFPPSGLSKTAIVVDRDVGDMVVVWLPANAGRGELLWPRHVEDAKKKCDQHTRGEHAQDLTLAFNGGAKKSLKRRQTWNAPSISQSNPFMGKGGGVKAGWESGTGGCRVCGLHGESAPGFPPHNFADRFAATVQFAF